MKKIYYILSLLILLTGLAACQDKAAPAASGVSSGESAAAETTSRPESSVAAPDGFQHQEVVFPANEIGKTEASAYLYEIAPFALQIDLPDGWTLKTPDEGEEQYAAGLFSPVNLYNDGQCVGTIAFNCYDAYPSPVEAEFHRSVYRQLLSDPKNSWDNAYTPVVQTKCAESATCKVTDASGSTHPAVLAYNKALLAYIAVEFAENAVTDEELQTIAKSISLALYAA